MICLHKKVTCNVIYLTRILVGNSLEYMLLVLRMSSEELHQIYKIRNFAKHFMLILISLFKISKEKFLSELGLEPWHLLLSAIMGGPNNTNYRY